MGQGTEPIIADKPGVQDQLLSWWDKADCSKLGGLDAEKWDGVCVCVCVCVCVYLNPIKLAIVDHTDTQNITRDSVPEFCQGFATRALELLASQI